MSAREREPRRPPHEARQQARVVRLPLRRVREHQVRLGTGRFARAGGGEGG